jgi:two-component system, OmpR family, sensor histidine kinase KdpD
MEPPASTAPIGAAVAPASARRGHLKVYLGATPGAGKTFAMLREGRERKQRGEDVVIAYVETYGRPRTEELLAGLELIPRQRVPYKGTVLEEMNVDAVIRRRPKVALVDELAHTNAPGLAHEKRWQDVEQLRDAGIDVISTINVQHVESVNDVVEKITGIVQRETLPDRVLDLADEIQFIDISPEALRKRMRHGNIYRPDKVDTALANFFRPGNLAALREIALRLVAQSMAASRQVLEPAEDVLVAISGGPSSEPLIRRAVRAARRLGGLCMVVLVGSPAGVKRERYQQLAGQVGCSFVSLGGSDVAKGIVEAAQLANVRHLFIGQSLRPSLLGRWRKTLADQMIDALPGIDLHVIAPQHPAAPPTSLEEPRRVPEDLLRAQPRAGRRAADARVYLGYADGSGTTTTMLDEARRRRSRGTDVVVAAISSRVPAAELATLELLGGPDASAAHDRLDLDALLARNPEVAVIDELNGLDTEGHVRADSIRRLLDAGITVLGTIHLLDLASVRESYAPLLKERAPGSVLPDDLLNAIDELEIVDVTPEVLLDRLRRGEIMSPAEAARALQAEFRPQILRALREMAFRIIADHTDRRLVAYMRERNIEEPWEARPRLVACIPPSPKLEARIERVAGFAARSAAQLTVVTVRPPRLTEADRRAVGEYTALVHRLGGEFVSLYGRNIAATLAGYVRKGLNTEIVLGRRRRAWRPWDTTATLIRMLADVDIHILRRDEATPAKPLTGSPPAGS